MYRKTSAVDKILKCKKRIRVIQGGSSAGKTIAILLILIDIAQSQKGKLISIVSETVPHLKRGVMRDFLSIMEEHGYFKENNWNRTDFIYTFETGCKIEFFSADSPDKVRGPRRDILFINEANNISYETYTQLSIRTNETVFIDYNPVQEFWVHTEIQGKLDHDFLILTYRDNEGLPPAIVKELESRRGNKYFATVYLEGQLGEAEGKIYTGWNIIDDIPHEARLERYGVDFGFTNDPTAIVAVYYFNGGYLVDELAYTKGLSAKQIADILLNEKRALVIADSADPRTIAEIRTYGLNVTGAVKRPGETKSDPYIRWSIGVVQDQRISITKRSTNIIKEYRNYLWLTDKDGKVLNEPDHLWSHSMDAIRYAVVSLAPMIRRKEMLEAMPRYPTPPRANIAV